jgi:phosphoribosylformylglycinamidine synthase
MVRTNTLAVPGAADAAVVRIKESAHSSGGNAATIRALALSTDGNGRWCYLNPRVGAMHAVAEAARNVACTGARPIAATNCFNFGSPEKPEVMWQFSEAIDGLTEACNALGTPITGGNVSFYNETLGNSIYPTPVIGVLGVLDDASKVVKIAFRESGDVILLLDGAAASVATPQQAAREFSSSEYSKTIAGIVAGEPPAIDLAAEKRLIDCLLALAAEGTVQSIHDISDGGFAVTVAESCFAASGLGAEVKFAETGSQEFALFGERGARAIVSVKPTFLSRVLDTARQCGVAGKELGHVTQNADLRIQYQGRPVIDSPVDKLRDAWTHSLERILKVK